MGLWKVHPLKNVEAFRSQPQFVEKSYCILSTKDSGKSWTKQFETLQTTRTLPCQIQFLNTQDGFARLNNDLFNTADGGESWKKICSMDDFMSMDFKDNKEGWASNADSILHTTDGGNTWSKEWSISETLKKRFDLVSSKVITNSGFEGWALFAGESTMSHAAKIIIYQSGDWTVERCESISGRVARAPRNAQALTDPCLRKLTHTAPHLKIRVLLAINTYSNSWLYQREHFKQVVEPFPCVAALLTSAIEPFKERLERPVIVGLMLLLLSVIP